MAIFFSYFNESRHSAQQKLCSICPPSSYYIRRSHNSARTFAPQLSSPAKASIWTDHVLVWARSGELLIGIQLHNNSLQWPNKILDAAFYPLLNLPPSEVERTPCLDHDTPPKFIRACLQLYLLPPPLMCTLYPSVLTRWLFDNLLMFFFTPHSMYSIIAVRNVKFWKLIQVKEKKAVQQPKFDHSIFSRSVVALFLAKETLFFPSTTFTIWER